MLDWDDLRFFLAVARTGSLSAAARDLRCTQTTVGRRPASIEARLGVRLLNRTPRDYVATPAGESIRQHTERIEIEALAIERIIAGQDMRLEGHVAVAVSSRSPMRSWPRALQRSTMSTQKSSSSLCQQHAI